MRAAGQGGAASLDSVPPVPEAVVARARWLGDRWLSEVAEMRADTFREVGDLVALIAGDVEQRRFAAAPDPQFVRLAAIALERPDLLQILVQRARRDPLLIAEFLIQQATCALGCWLLALRSSGQMVPEDDPHGSELALAALQDGLALHQRFLQGDAPGSLPAEAAALLAGAFDTSGRPKRSRSASRAEAMILEALGQLGQKAAPIGEAFGGVEACATLDAPALVAALELVAAADLAEVVAPERLPDAYADMVRTGDSELSACRMSPEAAAALFRLAQRLGRARLVHFLYPLDWCATLIGLGSDDHDGRHKLIRSLEASTRFLAKAVSGLAGDAPGELVVALADHVVAGSEDDWSNGRIWAFASHAPLLHWFDALDVTLGTLLGNALSTLGAAAREPLLLACLELREPALLAHIHKTAPREDRERIAARIEELGVDRALPVYSLATMQERVDALLDAGLTAAAETHMQVARQAATRAKIPERPRIEFNHSIRLLYQKGDWPAIAEATIPEGLPQLEREACRQILESFQAIALLQDENASPEIAVARLEKLVSENPAEPGHQVNLFAARISAMLGPANFPIFAADRKKPARRLAAEVEKWIVATAEATESDRYICTSNLVPLDLALGDPRRALERLQALPAERESATHAAYLAIAYGRLDRMPDAHDALDKAFELFCETLLLRAARDYLVGDGSAGSHGSAERLLFALGVDELRRLQFAIRRFLARSARDKAAILREGPDPLPGLVIEYVDAALSGVHNLAPLLRKGTLRDDEDDITAIVKQLLNARFHFLGVSTADQGKGGFTPSGNSGERDLVLVDGTTELALIEAVIADGTVRNTNLVSHFRKMLGYGACSLYFHLTYAWRLNTAQLISVLRDLARDEAPSNHAFEGFHTHERAGNEPAGFTARYRVDGQLIHVVFRVLDLGQERLRHAAASAALPTNSPSRRSRKKKSSR